MFSGSKRTPPFYKIEARSPTSWDHARCGDQLVLQRAGTAKGTLGINPHCCGMLERSWQGGKHPAHTRITLPRLGNPLLLITVHRQGRKTKINKTIK